jgi:hypothetical protein
LFLVASEASAQAPVISGQVLKRVGEFLGLEAVSYVLGKGVDKALGLDCEQELKDVERSVLVQLQHGRADADGLRSELAAVRSQLKLLDTLFKTKPAVSEVLQLKQKVDADLAKMLEIQKKHTQQIQDLERRVQSIETKMASRTEAETSAPEPLSGRRIEAPEPVPGRERAPAERPREVESPKSSPWSGRSYERPSRRPAGRRGVSLTISVTGSSNHVYVEETEVQSNADVGSFEVAEVDGRQTFRLLGGTGGVVSLYGDDNTVYLPAQLCGRVRLVPRGRRNRITGCPRVDG